MNVWRDLAAIAHARRIVVIEEIVRPPFVDPIPPPVAHGPIDDTVTPLARYVVYLPTTASERHEEEDLR